MRLQFTFDKGTDSSVWQTPSITSGYITMVGAGGGGSDTASGSSGYTFCEWASDPTTDTSAILSLGNTPLTAWTFEAKPGWKLCMTIPFDFNVNMSNEKVIDGLRKILG